MDIFLWLKYVSDSRGPQNLHIISEANDFILQFYLFSSPRLCVMQFKGPTVSQQWIELINRRTKKENSIWKSNGTPLGNSVSSIKPFPSTLSKIEFLDAQRETRDLCVTNKTEDLTK